VAGAFFAGLQVFLRVVLKNGAFFGWCFVVDWWWIVVG
jgi:hypothetical protein